MERKEKKKVFIRTFGCQMNDVDSERLLARLEKAGFLPAERPENADILIVNTCSVRAHAEQRGLGYLCSLKHLKNSGRIFCLIGCTASLYGQELVEKYPFIDLVCSPGRLPEFPDLLAQAEKGSRVVATGEGGWPFLQDLPQLSDQVTASLYVTRGCSNFCSYCVVPFTRGRLVSRPKKEIVDEVKHLTEQGVREITLLGQNVNQYGADLPDGHSFVKLLCEVHEISGVSRLRFLTSHPKDVPRELLLAFRDLPKLYRHFHLPVQAGSSKILKAMGRGYDASDYLRLIDAVRSLVPEVTITSDVMVGFPLEEEEDFEQTLTLVERVRFHDLFVFKYSPRPGTAAARWGDPVSPEVKARRHRVILELQQSIS
ncbi:MAG TPA: tRNA (N6-isopentenyl adenosine(37)-C2)-methylthiotransferase MiaB, partial [bacterium]|nr:tRNA (N6-isopentenyl adenosine(37)-C2)-methylthiotransferase MiaB [bacterium]